MKAFRITVFPNTRMETICVFPWDGGTIKVQTIPDWISSGELSLLSNRNCTHVKIDTSLAGQIEPEWFNAVSYYDPAFDNRLWKTDRGYLASLTNGFPHREVEANYSTVKRYYHYEMYAMGATVMFHYGVHSTYANGTTQTMDGYYTLPIVEGSSSCAGTKLIVNVYTSGRRTENTGTFTSASVSWFNSVPSQSYNYDPETFFNYYPGNALRALDTKHSVLKSWGELSSDCMDGFYGKVNNGIQYSAEMTQLSKLAEPLVQLMQGNVSTKVLTSAYLSYEYGARLSAKDTYSYLSAITRNRDMRSRYNFSRLYARDRSYWKDTTNGFDIVHTRNLTIYYLLASSFIAKAKDAVRKAGFLPSVEIAWDFVPFSFVVDWFSPIGDAIALFDKKGVFDQHDFLASVLTDKVEYTIDLSKNYLLPGTGTLKVTTYIRRVQSTVPKPAMKFDDLDLSYRQIRNGVALLLQNWR